MAQRKDRVMAMYEFDCPQCGRRLETDVQYCGKVVECPHCEKGIVVPRNKVKLELKSVKSNRIDLSEIREKAPVHNISSNVNNDKAIKYHPIQSKDSQNKMDWMVCAILYGIAFVNILLLLLVCVLIFKQDELNDNQEKLKTIIGIVANNSNMVVVSKNDHTNIVAVGNEKKIVLDNSEKGKAKLADTAHKVCQSPAETTKKEPISESIVAEHDNGTAVMKANGKDLPVSKIDNKKATIVLPKSNEYAVNGDVEVVIKRVCNGSRLTGKEWTDRIRIEVGIERLHNKLNEDLAKAGYWAKRIEAAGMAILVGRTMTSEYDGLIEQGWGGGFTYPQWLPAESAKYIYEAFWKLDFEEKMLLKKVAEYDAFFKKSDFYITPEEEERIEQAARLEYAMQLLSSLSFAPSRYFYIQKRLSKSIVTAKITDRKWKLLSEAQSKKAWLEMINIIRNDGRNNKLEKFPDKEEIVSIYKQILDHGWNVNVKLTRTGICAPNISEMSDLRRIDDVIKQGRGRSEIVNNYGEDSYARYIKITSALKKMNSEDISYPIDLNFSLCKVERNGDIKNMDYTFLGRQDLVSSQDFGSSSNWGDNDKLDETRSFSFKFSLGEASPYVLFVDDEWYWEQSISEPLRKKMSNYMDLRNRFYSEIIGLGKAVNEEMQYDRAEAITKHKEIDQRYEKLLFRAISNFMGISVVLPPVPIMPEKKKKENSEYKPLHEENDDVIDITHYELSIKNGNRFDKYEKRQKEYEKEQREQVRRAMYDNTSSKPRKTKEKSTLIRSPINDFYKGEGSRSVKRLGE